MLQGTISEWFCSKHHDKLSKKNSLINFYILHVCEKWTQLAMNVALPENAQIDFSKIELGCMKSAVLQKCWVPVVCKHPLPPLPHTLSLNSLVYLSIYSVHFLLGGSIPSILGLYSRTNFLKWWMNEHFIHASLKARVLLSLLRASAILFLLL
jgi:hypothetical protein